MVMLWAFKYGDLNSENTIPFYTQLWMQILCTICTDPVKQTEILHSTNCGHLFHHNCLAEWIERSNTCPQCRRLVTDRCIFRVYPTVSDETPKEVVELKKQLNEASKTLQTFKDNEELLKLYTVELDKRNCDLETQKTLVEMVNDDLKRCNTLNEVLRENVAFLNSKMALDDMSRARLSRKLGHLGVKVRKQNDIFQNNIQLLKKLFKSECEKLNWRKKLYDIEEECIEKKFSILSQRLQLGQSSQKKLTTTLARLHAVIIESQKSNNNICKDDIVEKLSKMLAEGVVLPPKSVNPRNSNVANGLKFPEKLSNNSYNDETKQAFKIVPNVLDKSRTERPMNNSSLVDGGKSLSDIFAIELVVTKPPSESSSNNNIKLSTVSTEFRFASNPQPKNLVENHNEKPVINPSKKNEAISEAKPKSNKFNHDQYMLPEDKKIAFKDLVNKQSTQLSFGSYQSENAVEDDKTGDKKPLTNSSKQKEASGTKPISNEKISVPSDVKTAYNELVKKAAKLPSNGAIPKSSGKIEISRDDSVKPMFIFPIASKPAEDKSDVITDFVFPSTSADSEDSILWRKTLQGLIGSTPRDKEKISHYVRPSEDASKPASLSKPQTENNKMDINETVKKTSEFVPKGDGVLPITLEKLNITCDGPENPKVELSKIVLGSKQLTEGKSSAISQDIVLPAVSEQSSDFYNRNVVASTLQRKPTPKSRGNMPCDMRAVLDFIEFKSQPQKPNKILDNTTVPGTSKGVKFDLKPRDTENVAKSSIDDHSTRGPKPLQFDNKTIFFYSKPQHDVKTIISDYNNAESTAAAVQYSSERDFVITPDWLEIAKEEMSKLFSLDDTESTSRQFSENERENQLEKLAISLSKISWPKIFESKMPRSFNASQIPSTSQAEMFATKSNDGQPLFRGFLEIKPWCVPHKSYSYNGEGILSEKLKELFESEWQSHGATPIFNFVATRS
ncbi:uncharacterized protein LOC128678057 isoform X2 [Plodia interpunctella]|uniref:uncharacterized protein LOC128678057 isoform X2 n=1 Tax=Plodia interpunctella TaxID=58824 RepID=UPI002368D73F|nr:uncharacterized protein LOC128678057 isoform X2 [Plodia interpunctella]